ncbi:MAG: CsgG/HfaB family protein [Actinomycetota bacterium]
MSSPTLRRSTRRALALGALAIGCLAAAPLRAQSSDRRPTVAVLPFENGAMKDRADYEPLTKGVAEMLVTAMAANPAVRVVERDRLQKLLDEQNLAASGRVDNETAVRIGKLLGVHHMLTGTYVIDPKQRVRLVARSINTETGVIEHAESVTGKADDMLVLIDQLGTKLNDGLKLPSIPFRVGTVPGAGSNPSSVSNAVSKDAAPMRTVSNTPAKGGANQFRAMMLVSRALEKQDKGDTQGAIALYKSALTEYPDFDRAKTLLASAERTPTAP